MPARRFRTAATALALLSLGLTACSAGIKTGQGSARVVSTSSSASTSGSSSDSSGTTPTTTGSVGAAGDADDAAFCKADTAVVADLDRLSSGDSGQPDLSGFRSDLTQLQQTAPPGVAGDVAKLVSVFGPIIAGNSSAMTDATSGVVVTAVAHLNVWAYSHCVK